MKNHFKYITFFLLLLHINGFAQKAQLANEGDAFSQYVLRNTVNYDTPHKYYVVLSSRGLDPAIKVIRKVSESISIIEINDKWTFEKLHHSFQLSIANSNWKLSPALEKALFTKKGAEKKFILASQSFEALINVLEKHPQAKILYADKQSNSVIIKCSAAYLQQQLLHLNEVIFADIVTEAHVETAIIGYNRSFHGINAVDYLIPGANGRNIVAGVKEQKMDEADIDLWKRVLPSSIASATSSYHATAIASIIGGAGNSFYYGRGLAWSCKFFPSTFSNLFADDAAILNLNRVSLQNHSYGTIIQQFYGAEAVSYDELTWNNKTMVQVIASGNQGNGFATEGKYANLSGFANLTGNFKMAKNVITVGAMDIDENIPPLSSAGPTYDGRLAPQLVALGPSGTSDAAAIVTGTVAVMQQVYADSNNNTLPPASLVKAVLYNTADDIHKWGIDYKTGYGSINSYAAVKTIQQKKYETGIVADGQEWQKDIALPSNIAELKVTLAWTDTTAGVNNNKAVINDLDLEIIEVNTGVIYQPWVLSSAANLDSLRKPAIRKKDSLNTSEQVTIQLPLAGTYQIKVKGTSLSSSTIPFNVAYKADTLNTFIFTNPLHASDLTKLDKETLIIRWKAIVADTNQTGNLYISYDNAASWQLLKSPLKLTSRKWEWAVKDTNSTAVLKMETPFGNFVSSPFVISKLTTVALDFNCADSFRLSWNKHIYANNYRIYALTDSPYLKAIANVSDSFIVLKKTLFPSLVYAVEPVLNNNLPAARSVAVNIELQGVKCFYKTLNYELLDTNKLNLILELSTITNVDSIYFEQVTSDGILLKTYNGSKAVGTLIYTQFVSEISPGITYLRAKIKLKDGALVYTDIISVITSGKKNILFYPNPVMNGSKVKYVLQQGLSPDNAFQLFDIYGRLLKNYSSMPDEIDVSGLSSGIIIYKLFDAQNRTIETGKLVIIK